MSENGMGISRRGFVAGAGATALGVGLAGGIVGCAPGAEKESEHTAGVEKTAYDPKAGEWIPTTCNMCFNNCSIKAHVIDGVVVELTGNPDSSIGRGHICGKGASGIMQLYDPNRITKPLKRTNPKKGFDEDPGWEEISWDEAYGLVDEHMKAAIERSGPHAVTGMSMVASQIGSLVRHTALGVIYGNAEGSCSDICGAGVHQIEYLFTGTGNARPDYVNCNYVVQFGTNAGTATRHGYNMTVEPFAERRKNGLRHVVFDPHMGAAGEKADLWVPIRPGTDAAAALAIAYVLVHEETSSTSSSLRIVPTALLWSTWIPSASSSTRRQGIRCTWIPTARRSLTIGAAPPNSRVRSRWTAGSARQDSPCIKSI
ncbi:molybdopterin-dependent oxidoreductase [Eggerthella sp.]|uniref:molybdopterin-dependent oxidoreductase n=1 Tax=Eggerthella sp. TaxID=1929886 RepID=UPI002840E862|nr:molybdopterin-dependent oxidoreductase [Eggerthella sp.]MDR3849540.1 molybdopterin-dependent oxidoreductase [Eggerthella sp.]